MSTANSHILFIAPSAYTLGGLATWLDYLVPGLRERGWRVTLGLVEGKFHKVDAYLGVHPHSEVMRIPCGTGTPEGRVRQISRAICGLRPEIVVAVNIADAAPAVQRVRENTEWALRIVMAMHAIQPDFIGLIKNDTRVLDAIVCSNRLACELVSRCTPVDQNRIHYAPCGVSWPMIPTNRPQSPDGRLRIAFVGRLERKQKRIEDLLAITAHLDSRGVGYELLIAGGGPDEKWLQVQFADAVNRGRVRLLGTLAGIDLAEQVYSLSDALLITSPCETGPIVAWEAMAHGVIVVTSAYIGSGVEGSLQSGENCLMFPIGDATTAVDCLVRLADLELCARLRTAGLALVAQRYSTRVSTEQWDAALREIAARLPMPPTRSAEVMELPPAGRLDRLFGRQVAETIRELFSLRYDHGEAGGEWPHANPAMPVDEEAFWQLARSLDRRPCDQVTRGPFKHPHLRKGHQTLAPEPRTCVESDVRINEID